MQPDATPFTSRSLSVSLSTLASIELDEAITLERVFAIFQGKGFGILLVLLSLPSALPIPAPGYSTPFGLALLFIGFQMLIARSTPWLPAWLGRFRLGHTMTRRMASAGTRFFEKTEHLIRPRLPWLSSSPGQKFAAFLVIVMSLLMCLPIPLTNTLPAMVIFLLGVSLCEEDGLFGLGAALVGLLALTLYAFIVGLAVYLFLEYGWDGLQGLNETVRERLTF